ncbi:MAG: hypothetical protein WCK29_01075 [archaeon]
MDNLPKEVLDKLKGKDINEVCLKVIYKNYKGEVGERRIIPMEVYYGSNEYHKSEQWLMKVWDLDKNAFRDYALRDIIEWKN